MEKGDSSGDDVKASLWTFYNPELPVTDRQMPQSEVPRHLGLPMAYLLPAANKALLTLFSTGLAAKGHRHAFWVDEMF